MLNCIFFYTYIINLYIYLLESRKKQKQNLEQQKKDLIYQQVVDNALLNAKAYIELAAGNISPFIKILKTFLLSRSRMSLLSANEYVLQGIVEALLPLQYRVPELSLVMDSQKQKGNGHFGYSDIFVLKATSNIYVSLELKYISLVNLTRNEEKKYGANELERLDKILDTEDIGSLLKRQYSYWSKELNKMEHTTIHEVLNNGMDQLKSYMNTISNGQAITDYSGVFDERIKITKSDPHKLKGFVLLVIGFRRVLHRSVEEITSNYRYDRI